MRCCVNINDTQCKLTPRDFFLISQYLKYCKNYHALKCSADNLNKLEIRKAPLDISNCLYTRVDFLCLNRAVISASLGF